LISLGAPIDDDIHLALKDATGDKPAIVVYDVSAKPMWGKIPSQG